MKLFLMIFPRISLHCMLVPVQNREYETDLFCTHGSEVRTGRDQRDFFLLVRSRSRLCRSLSPQHKTKQKQNNPLAPSVCQTIIQSINCTWVSVIPDFIKELVAAAVGESVLNSAGVKGATPAKVHVEIKFKWHHQAI